MGTGAAPSRKVPRCHPLLSSRKKSRLGVFICLEVRSDNDWQTIVNANICHVSVKIHTHRNVKGERSYCFGVLKIFHEMKLFQSRGKSQAAQLGCWLLQGIHYSRHQDSYKSS